jgi:membrane protein implicated in regulation of membrane protease activity
MQVIYRRRGGILALVAFAAIALVATFFAVAVAVTTLVVVFAAATVAMIVRAFMPGRRRGQVAARAQGQHRADTIEGTVVRRIE